MVMGRTPRNDFGRRTQSDKMRTESEDTIAVIPTVNPIKGGECIRTRITFPGTISRNGNSYMITVPAKYLEKLNLKKGDDIDVTISLPDTSNEEDD